MIVRHFLQCTKKVENLKEKARTLLIEISSAPFSLAFCPILMYYYSCKTLKKVVMLMEKGNKRIIFFDLEIDKSGKICDFGAISETGDKFHNQKRDEFLSFIESAEYLCGHNIFNHDLKYIVPYLKNTFQFIDTLVQQKHDNVQRKRA